MKRTVIVGVKVELLQENGRVPKSLDWIGEIPPSYSINVIERENGKTIVALVDSFAGGIAYALTDEKVTATGKAIETDDEELSFLKKNYPNLHKEITA